MMPRIIAWAALAGGVYLLSQVHFRNPWAEAVRSPVPAVASPVLSHLPISGVPTCGENCK